MSAYAITLTVADSGTSQTTAGNVISIETVQVVGTVVNGGSVTSVAGRTGAVVLTSSDLTDTTAAGRALLDDANAAAQRNTLGLGTAAVAATGDFEAAGGIATHAALTSSVHGISAFGATLVDDANASAARTTLGLGTAATSGAGDFAAAVHTHGSESINTTQTDDATTSRSLSDSDHGKVIRFTSGSSVAVTVPNTLRSDFTCCVIQDGAGQVTFTGSSATVRNRQSHTKTAGQYAAVTIVKVSSGEFRLAGDTAA